MENKTQQKPYDRKWYHIYNYCAQCPHNSDAHDMNCLECCPVKNKEVESGGDYLNKEELAKKHQQKIRQLLTNCF